MNVFAFFGLIVLFIVVAGFCVYTIYATISDTILDARYKMKLNREVKEDRRNYLNNDS